MPAAFTAAEIINASRGSLVQGRAQDSFVGVSTDSRTCQAGGLFIPLKGETHDGHDYIPKAISRGVRGVVVEGRLLHQNGVMARVPPGITTIAVSDTLTVLGTLAQAWRRRFAIPVVSLTGSCGKTTAKEMIALILSRFYRVLKNELNLNNLIGLPQTLLQLDGSFDAAVVEMGMNRFGEIRPSEKSAASPRSASPPWECCSTSTRPTPRAWAAWKESAGPRPSSSRPSLQRPRWCSTPTTRGWPPRPRLSPGAAWASVSAPKPISGP